MNKTRLIVATVVIAIAGFFVWFDTTPEIKQDIKEEPVYPRAKIIR